MYTYLRLQGRTDESGSVLDDSKLHFDAFKIVKSKITITDIIANVFCISNGNRVAMDLIMFSLLVVGVMKPLLTNLILIIFIIFIVMFIILSIIIIKKIH